MGNSFTATQFAQVIEFADDAAMQKKWKAFCRKIDTKPDAFDEVLKMINRFLREPFKAAISDDNFEEKWNATENKWK